MNKKNKNPDEVAVAQIKMLKTVCVEIDGRKHTLYKDSVMSLTADDQGEDYYYLNIPLESNLDKPVEEHEYDVMFFPMHYNHSDYGYKIEPYLMN